MCCKISTMKINPLFRRAVSMRENFIKIVKLGDESYAVFESKCKNLKGNMCGIYDRRPQTCKIFPSEIHKKLWKKICPNCGML